MPGFIYRRSGEVHAPTEWAGSPWSRELQHGGPVCGLIATAAEAAAHETGLRVVRLSVDLFRPTPLQPLALAWRFVRRGRRLALVEVRLATATPTSRAERPAARAERGARQQPAKPEPPPPGPEGLEAIQFMPASISQGAAGLPSQRRAAPPEDELGPALWATSRST
jgi:hypothetical protein